VNAGVTREQLLLNQMLSREQMLLNQMRDRRKVATTLPTTNRPSPSIGESFQPVSGKWIAPTMKRMEPKARLKQKSNTNHQYRYDENVTLTTKHGVDTLQKLANESTEDAKSVASHTSFVDWDQNIIADNANNHRIGEEADESGRDNDGAYVCACMYMYVGGW